MFEPDNSEMNLEQQVVQDRSVSELPNKLVVSILEDENDGDFSAGDLSLREALAQAESDSTITFDSSLSGGTINLALGELSIDKSLTINGLGAKNILIDADGNSRVFNVDDRNADSQLEVGLNDLTITGGSFPGSTNTQAGGGIFSNENLEINNAVIRDNFFVASGAGIYSGGTLTVNNSAIYNNSADGAGGGNSGGGIFNAGTAIITNSTISNNEVANRGFIGGGIANEGTLTVTNSTVSGNRTGISNNGEATLTSTIVAGNDLNNDLQDGDFDSSDNDDDFISGGNNLIGGETKSFDTVSAGGFTDGENGDIVGTADNPIDPQLGELQDNGGATPTQALLEGSPAIDAGSNPNNLETDQRGQRFDRTIGDGTDIGAFEVQEDDGGEIPTELVVSTLTDENDGDFSQGDLSLREAIALANEQEGADTITFNSDLSGGTININSSLERELIIDDSVAINGLGQDNLTLDGGFIFNIAQNDDVAIDGLNLTGGKIDSFGDLSFTNSTLSQTINRPGSSDNSSIISRGTANITDSSIIDNDGGDDIGILIESGTATIEGSTIANNEGVLGGSGVLILTDETVDISNSTIANNRNRFVGGVANAGGGTVNITNTTIANNNGGLGSGGIQNSSGTVTITSSILANNTGGGFIGDISGDGEFISGGNNLISNGDDAEGFVDGVNGDIVGSNGDDGFNPETDLLIDARLGELQDNGGSTETIALLDGSPAIDAGSNPNNLETDQRGEGFERTVGNGTDIGAFEVQQGVSTPDESDPDNLISTANDSGISPQGQQNIVLNDEIASNADVDLFKLNLEAGDVATFNIEAREFGSSLDSVLRIFNSEGSELASDDDSNAPFEASNFDSYIEYQAEADGEYYVGVSSFANFVYDPVNGSDTEGSSSGDYDLAISVFNGINGTSNADNLSGTQESDFIQGFDGNDTLNGGNQKDNLLGGSGNDVLTGRNGDDLLRASAGFDVLRGGNGNDTLGGGDGQNRLSGGRGNDIFAIGSGEDTINDFRDGSDKLLLTGDLEFTPFEELTISAVGTGTTISAFNNTYATLTGISPERITTDDIVAPDFLAANFLFEDSTAIAAK